MGDNSMPNYNLSEIIKMLSKNKFDPHVDDKSFLPDSAGISLI
jgi:hypothetical protein